jgi:hypothetical protein
MVDENRRGAAPAACPFNGTLERTMQSSGNGDSWGWRTTAFEYVDDNPAIRSRFAPKTQRGRGCVELHFHWPKGKQQAFGATGSELQAPQMFRPGGRKPTEHRACVLGLERLFCTPKRISRPIDSHNKELVDVDPGMRECRRQQAVRR